MLELVEVHKTYNGKQILNIPSLNLEKGVYWVQGPNGSGKTTLLRMIAGLLPFKGDILFCGVSIRHHPVKYRSYISWSDAEPLYPPFITGKELIAFYRHVRKAPFEQIDKLVSIFGINDFISIPIGSYSSGMIKKLSLLFSFHRNPSLIVLDEPLTTLDAAAVPIVLQLIKNTHQQLGISFLISSHHNVETSVLLVHKNFGFPIRTYI